MIGNFFPMVGKFAPFFQPLEKFFLGFPMIGKIFRNFSNDWKKVFQWLENSAPRNGVAASAAEG
ncbi:MAG: hypothetical protein IKQ55_05000 [Kiritimatiellae bacterium]|nr:hypothetical protein [Kiritimatiellia bacterium]